MQQIKIYKCITTAFKTFIHYSFILRGQRLVRQTKKQTTVSFAKFSLAKVSPNEEA